MGGELTTQDLPIPIDTSCRGEYEDGYIHDETLHSDVSPYDDPAARHNIFHDILHRKPEATHGKLVKFTVFYRNNRYDIDWRKVPEGASPIRLRYGISVTDATGGTESSWSAVEVGYQWLDENANKLKHTEIIH